MRRRRMLCRLHGLQLLIAACALVGTSCFPAGGSDGLDDEGVVTDDDGSADEDSFDLGVAATCNHDGQAIPTVVLLQVFSESSGTRILSSNTNGDGEYCSGAGLAFTSDSSLRVEFWDPDVGCIMWVSGLDPVANAEWFPEECGSDFATTHLGDCFDYEPIDDCWGS